MFGDKEGKPVDVIAVESFKAEGEHVERGTIIKAMAPELAMELAGAGKVRAATKEAVAEINASVKAQAAVKAQEASVPDPMAQMVAAAVTAALQAAGVVKPAAAPVPAAA